MLVMAFLAIWALSQKTRWPLEEIKTVPEKEPVKIVYVYDGDTFDIEENDRIQRVRLLGLDTPEVESPYEHEECFGAEASEYLKKLLIGQEVILTDDVSAGDRDKYNRLLRYAFLPNGLFINAHLIEQGFAKKYLISGLKYESHFKELERDAKIEKIGLWGACKEEWE